MRFGWALGWWLAKTGDDSAPSAARFRVFRLCSSWPLLTNLTITLPAGTAVRERTKWNAGVFGGHLTCAGPAGAVGVSDGGLPPAEPGGAVPEPGAGAEPGRPREAPGSTGRRRPGVPGPLGRALRLRRASEVAGCLCLRWDFFPAWAAGQRCACGWRWQARAAWEERWRDAWRAGRRDRHGGRVPRTRHRARRARARSPAAVAPHRRRSATASTPRSTAATARNQHGAARTEAASGITRPASVWNHCSRSEQYIARKSEVLRTFSFSSRLVRPGNSPTILPVARLPIRNAAPPAPWSVPEPFSWGGGRTPTTAGSARC